VSNGSSKPLTLIPVGIFHPSGSPVIVDLQAARGRGMIWAGYDATVTAPNGSLHEGLVWKEHIPFFVPTNEQTQRVATSAKNELELLNGPLATLQGRSVPRVFGAWATPDGEAFGMLLEDAGRELTREESEDPGIR
jgi:hypothetical protein